MCRILTVLVFPSVRMNRRGVLACPPKRRTHRGRGESRALRLHAAFALDHRVLFSSSYAATPAFLDRLGSAGAKHSKASADIFAAIQNTVYDGFRHLLLIQVTPPITDAKIGKIFHARLYPFARLSPPRSGALNLAVGFNPR